MSTRFESESFNPLSVFFEEEEEDETRGRKRFRGMPGPTSRVRSRLDFVKRKSPFLRPIRHPRPRFPRPFPFPAFPFPPVHPPGREPASEPASPPSDLGEPRDSTPSGSAAAPPESGRVPEGSEFVRWVQSSLNRILGLKLPIDGVMDVQTRSAVRSFQSKNGLPPDGIVGPPTERALTEATTAQRSPEGGGQGTPGDAGKEPPEGGAQQPTKDEEIFESFPQAEFPYNEFGLASENENWQSELGRSRSRRRGNCNCHQTRADSGTSEFGAYNLTPEVLAQDEGEAFEYEFNLADFPQSVLTMLRTGLESAGLKLAVTFGFRNETQLTNLVFFARHPERFGRGITAGEPNYSGLVREWISIRDTVVRPAVRGSTAPAAPGYQPSAPAFPYQSTPAASAPTLTPTTEGPDIVSVRGVNVARQIAPQVEGLLAAAEAAGLRLSGGGYRSREAQIELRKRHCGTSQFDIFERPSSQCTPPTAPPGRSQHQLGLAIDFTYGGRTIKSQSSPAFQWLKANAARFGLYNLPSEPWHWSINGR